MRFLVVTDYDTNIIRADDWYSLLDILKEDYSINDCLVSISRLPEEDRMSWWDCDISSETGYACHICGAHGSATDAYCNTCGAVMINKINYRVL